MTPLQVKLVLLGKLGKGPIELCHAHGALVDQRVPYAEAVTLAGQALGDLVSEGSAETIMVPSPFTKSEYRVWRLPSKTKLEKRPADPWFASTPDADVSSAAEQASGIGEMTPSTKEAPASGAGGNRVITPEQFRELAARKRK